MKILTPITDQVSLGSRLFGPSEEFYIGYHDGKAQKLFNPYGPLNRMSDFPMSSPCALEDIRPIAEQIHSCGKKLFVTINALSYTDAQMEYIKKNHLSKLAEYKIDGAIVSTLAMARAVSEYGIRPVASTICAIDNNDIMQVYREAGVGRVILPREYRIKEIAAFHKDNPDIEIEVFGMLNKCFFDDAYCMGSHIRAGQCGGGICYSITNIAKTTPLIIDKNFEKMSKYEAMDENGCNTLLDMKKTLREGLQRYTKDQNSVDDMINTWIGSGGGCCLCALYDLKIAGVSTLKVVGRGSRNQSFNIFLDLLQKNLNILKHCECREEYLDNMYLPDSMMPYCASGTACYYPEIRYPDEKEN